MTENIPKRGVAPVALTRIGLTAVFGAYWLAALLVVAHNNPLRVQLHGLTTGLVRWIPQQWTFFSPPSSANRRIHFHYSTARGETVLVLNALEPVLRHKRERKPFNYPESKLDYILNHSCDLLAAHVVAAQERDPTLGGNEALGEYMRSLARQQPMPPELKTLLSYGLDALRRQRPHLAGADHIELVVTDVPIRRFKDRNQTDEPEVRTNFRSGPVPLALLTRAP